MSLIEMISRGLIARFVTKQSLEAMRRERNANIP